MSDVALFFKVGKRLDECRPIVCDDFTQCAPSAEDVFKNPISDGLAVSVQIKWYLGKCAREQRPCMKYLKPPDFGRCMVSMYILVNKGVGVATTSGMRTLWVWHS